MTMSLTCKKCGRVMRVPDTAAGKKAKCPKCGTMFDIPMTPPPAPAAGPDKHAAAPTKGQALDALARAVEKASPPAAQAPAANPPAAPSPPATSPEPEPAPAVAPAAEVAPVPTERAVTKTEPTSPWPAAPRATTPHLDSEVIAVQPIGVQTPSGLPVRGRRAIASRRKWQRTMANLIRIVGFLLAGLCVPIGVVGMFAMILRSGDLLLPALGLFIFMLVTAGALAFSGVAARQILLMLADLDDQVRRNSNLLDDMNERIE